jgi:hypothetical protein
MIENSVLFLLSIILTSGQAATDDEEWPNNWLAETD